MYLGIDVGFSNNVRSTGICIIDQTAAAPVQCAHVGTNETFRAIADLLKHRKPLAISLDGPLVPTRTGALRFRLARRYRSCERLLSGGIFQKRCKPGPTNSPRGFSLHQQTTALANGLIRKFPRTLIQESFPNAFLGVQLPSSSFQTPIRRGIKSDVFWRHCVEQKQLASLIGFLFKKNAGAIHEAAAALDNHDERAAFVCAMTACGAHRNVNSLIGNGKDGSIALPPKEFIQKWAWDAITERGALLPDPSLIPRT